MFLPVIHSFFSLSHLEENEVFHVKINLFAVRTSGCLNDFKSVLLVRFFVFIVFETEALLAVTCSSFYFQ